MHNHRSLHRDLDQYVIVRNGDVYVGGDGYVGRAWDRRRFAVSLSTFSSHDAAAMFARFLSEVDPEGFHVEPWKPQHVLMAA